MGKAGANDIITIQTNQYPDTLEIIFDNPDTETSSQFNINLNTLGIEGNQSSFGLWMDKRESFLWLCLWISLFLIVLMQRRTKIIFLSFLEGTPIRAWALRACAWFVHASVATQLEREQWLWSIEVDVEVLKISATDLFQWDFQFDFDQFPPIKNFSLLVAL